MELENRGSYTRCSLHIIGFNSDEVQISLTHQDLGGDVNLWAVVGLQELKEALARLEQEDG